MTSRWLKNVMSAVDKTHIMKKRNLHGLNEHVESFFNAESASVIVFQQPARQDDSA